MTEKIITENSQNFQYFSGPELTKLRNENLVHSCEKGQVLFYPGDPRNYLILSVPGVTKIEKNDRGGNFSYLHSMKKWILFPGIGLFRDEVHYDSAIVYTDIEAVLVPVKLLEHFLQDNPQQLVHWIQGQLVPLKGSTIKIQKGTASDACERIATSLVMLLDDLGERIDNRERIVVARLITISDIAWMSGITQETVSNVMKKLVQMGRISYNHKFLTLLDMPFFIDRLNN